MIEWEDLPHKLTRQRNKPTKSARREAIDDWTKDVQSFSGLIQPKRGKLDNEPEGEMPQATHVLYCNLVTQRAKGEPIDITVNDRVSQVKAFDSVGAGVAYRVLFVSDEGGQGDHLKVYLKTVGPNGD